jgi:hypothetical protein
MFLIAQIRILVTTLVLASYSPVGLDVGQPGHLALSLFTGRRTRVAASQEFQVGGREQAQDRFSIAPEACPLLLANQECPHSALEFDFAAFVR